MTSIRHLIPIALMSSLVAHPAVAGYSKTGSTARVSYADLNLESPDGVAKLDRRIARAVREVCGNRFMADHLNERREIERCGKETMLIVTPQRERAVAFANSKPIQLGARQR